MSLPPQPNVDSDHLTRLPQEMRLELVQHQQWLDGTSRKGNALGSLSEPGLLH
jgi:hypothetical protein